MKSRIMMSMLVIALVAAVIGGGTMAWFTAKAEVTNEFTAGTVMINLFEDTTWAATLNPDNVNPGDCFNKDFTITNTGTKYLLLRMAFAEVWEFDDWEWLWDNWKALCFTELDLETDWYLWLNARVGQPFNAAPYHIGSSDSFTAFKAYVQALEKPVKWDEIETDLLAAGFIYYDGYWYYDGKLGPDGNLLDPIYLNFAFDVCFDGATMNNFFQGVDYALTISFEAIQASNNASESEWDGAISIYNPATPQSGANWNGWGNPPLVP